MNILISIILILLATTLGVLFYLKKHQVLNKQGVKDNKNYLFVVYGIAIILAILLSFYNYNTSSQQITGNTILQSENTKMTLKVNIPCPGHAPLIINELNKIEGINDVNFNFPNEFEVRYTPSTIAKEEILSADIFSEYPAREI